MYTFFWVIVLVISTIIHTITGTKYYTVSTFAGGGSSRTGEATSVSLTQPEGIVVDSTGANVYFADSWGYKVRKVVQSTNTLSVLNTGYLFVSVAVDCSGNVYSSCVAFYSLIFKYSTTGVTSVIAGHSSNSACTNTVGSDNGVPGTSVCLSNPYGIATDTTSSFLYIADGYHVIRKLDLSTNLIYVVAGTISTSGYSGDNGLATIACLNTPEGVAVDSSNSFYIADKSNNRIRKVTASTGIITTIAGSSTSTGFSGDGGAPTSALLNSPHHVSLNPYDNSIIYFSDAGNYRIRVIDITNNIITSIKDSGGTDYGSTYIGSYVAFDYTNNYLFSAQLSKVYKLTELIPTATPTKSPTVAPTTNVCTTGFYTEYFVCSGVSYCCDSRCWITNTNDCGNGNFCSCTTGYYTTYITPPTDPPTITPTSAPSNDPTAAPTAYVITRIAGSSTGSTVGYNGDGIDSTSAYLWYPYGVAVDSASNVYITDGYNNRVRKISATTSIITTYAGYGPSYSGSFCCDGNAATNAALYTPNSLAIDSSDNLYFSDRSNDRIRKVTASTQIISTIAGTGTGTYDYDSGVATSVSINNPWGVAADNSGNVYFADNGNSLVRKVDTSTGTLTTLVGSGTLSDIVGLAINSAGDTLYVSDLTDKVIYVIDIPTNTLSSLSGLSSYYYGLAVDSSDDLIYTTFSIVYKRTMSTGISTVVAGGSGMGYSGDGGPPTSAKLGYFLNGVAYDKSNGNYFIADRSYHMIRKVTAQGTYGPTLAPTATPTVIPTNTPTLILTLTPTYVPTNFPQSPTGQPTRQPSAQPTRQPSAQPSSLPTNPTGQPTRQPSAQPSTQPSAQPSRQPTSSPSRQPTSQPTIRPSSQPSTHPSAQPSRQPTSQPSSQPTGYPTGQPTRQPTSQPTRQPTRQPTSRPSRQPTSQPSLQPTLQPFSNPSAQPTIQPSSHPSTQPTNQPSSLPTSQPTSQPSSQPSNTPSAVPSSQPSNIPSSQPSSQPTNPTSQPSSKPSSQPSGQPTMNPTNPTSTPTAAPSSVMTWWETAINYTKIHPAIVASGGICFIGLLIYIVMKYNELKEELGQKKRKKQTQVVPSEFIDENDEHPFFNSIYPEEGKVEFNHDHRDFHAPHHAPLGDHCPINTVF